MIPRGENQVYKILLINAFSIEANAPVAEPETVDNDEHTFLYASVPNSSPKEDKELTQPCFVIERRIHPSSIIHLLRPGRRNMLPPLLLLRLLPLVLAFLVARLLGDGIQRGEQRGDGARLELRGREGEACGETLPMVSRRNILEPTVDLLRTIVQHSMI